MHCRPDQLALAALSEPLPARDAEHLAGCPRCRDEVASLRRAAAGGTIDAALPLDVRASAFQRRVWQALQAIPRGQTRTYAQVAASIGRPSAARAVARACASNPTALVVPCHRVVPAGGGTGGYRWGSERKKKLLDGEAAKVPV